MTKHTGGKFNGIERRLNELSARLQRLEPLARRPIDDFLADAYLRDIVERNLEIAVQCCLDIAHRIISMERAPAPQDGYESILRLSELGVLPTALARKMAPMAGFRNILAHEYLSIDWNLVYEHLQHLDDFHHFVHHIRNWWDLRSRQGEPPRGET